MKPSPHRRIPVRLVPVLLVWWVVSTLPALAPPPAEAATFVMMSDAALADSAPAIIEGRVVAKDFAPTLDMAATDYTVEVDRVLKGLIPGSTLIVRVPGGVRPDGMAFRVYGAPQFDEGQRALLFLSPAQDGTYRLYQLMLGAFYQVRSQGQRLAVRNFDETHEVTVPGQELGEEERFQARAPRRFEAFSRWISDRVEGNLRQPDYFLQASDGLVPTMERFTLFETGDGLNLRWPDFDEGRTVFFRINGGGQPGLTRQQEETATRNGMRAWNTIPGTNIRYALDTTPTTASGGLATFDGVNALQFEDPNSSSDFGGPFSCVNGGVLAIAGPWLNPNVTIPGPGGRLYHPIGGGDVITNKGLECFFDLSPDRLAAASELFGHELGHTLGFRHSCGDDDSGACNTQLKDQALMRAFIHDDGRGAQINNDDRAAARFLYGTSSSGPASPSNLAALPVSPTQVQLSWVDNANDEDGFQVEQAVEGGAFREVGPFLPPDTREALIGNLTPNTTYTFRVVARNELGTGFSAGVTVTTPAKPFDLTAVPLSASEIFLNWQDNFTNEQSFLVQMSSPESPFTTQAVVQAGTQQLTVDGLEPSTPYTFRVQAMIGSGPSVVSSEASATTRDLVDPQECVQDARTLCLAQDRFRVRVEWRVPANPTQEASNGSGQAVTVPGSGVTGLFWFFSQSNIELVVKLLDGRTVNGFFWTFYGALSDVEYWISVLDTDTGESVTYHNPPGEICGLGDVRSFPRPEPAVGNAVAQVSSRPRVTPGDGESSGETAGLTARRLTAQAPVSLAATGGATGTCVPDDDTLCLLDNRFRVEVDWLVPGSGDSGQGMVRPVTTVDSDETGFFWFFNANNIELIVKILDARTIGSGFWVFYGGLSDVQYEIEVTDTVAGTSRTFFNAFQDICGATDQTTF